jgi:predicted DNA-binding transcriptional regulator YafY
MKTQLILLLYDTLQRGEKVERQSFCKIYAISERTFYRYIKEISLFIMRNKRTYILKEEEPNGVYFIVK